MHSVYDPNAYKELDNKLESNDHILLFLLACAPETDVNAALGKVRSLVPPDDLADYGADSFAKTRRCRYTKIMDIINVAHRYGLVKIIREFTASRLGLGINRFATQKFIELELIKENDVRLCEAKES